MFARIEHRNGLIERWLKAPERWPIGAHLMIFAEKRDEKEQYPLLTLALDEDIDLSFCSKPYIITQEGVVFGWQVFFLFGKLIRSQIMNMYTQHCIQQKHVL